MTLRAVMPERTVALLDETLSRIFPILQYYIQIGFYFNKDDEIISSPGEWVR